MEGFPQVLHNTEQTCKLFNAATMKYLCLSDDGFITNLGEGDDLKGKANFVLHFFHTLDEDRAETELVVPVHSSKTCLVMTPEKGLSTASRKDHNFKENTKADSSFFYFKNPGDSKHVVFEGMNGKESDRMYYLAVNEANMKLELQQKTGENYPRNMCFELITTKDNEV